MITAPITSAMWGKRRSFCRVPYSCFANWNVATQSENGSMLEQLIIVAPAPKSQFDLLRATPGARLAVALIDVGLIPAAADHSYRRRQG